MENPRVSSRMTVERLSKELAKIAYIIKKMADPDIFVWLPEKRKPTEQEVRRSVTVVADRLCGARADPIIRNAQEKRQLTAITSFLLDCTYELEVNEHCLEDTLSVCSFEWRQRHYGTEVFMQKT